MSRFATALLSTTGLSLLTLLAIIPSKLNAEPNPQKVVDSRPPTATTAQTSSNPPAISLPAITKPLTGVTISTPNQPITNNSLPTAIQKPISKPAVTAATSETPATDVVNLILKLKQRKVYVYKGNQVVANYPVAIGKKGTETPTGEWYVMEKIENPGWTNFNTGKVMKPGPKNPLGERWIGFWTDGKDTIGFHGTPTVSSIGTAASNGCVRMFNKDVKELFPLVKVGTTVKVVNE